MHISCNKLGRGRTLGAALDGLASREETLLISSAQDSSRLAGGLLLTSKVLDAKSSIRKSLIGALAYPLMLMLLIVIMMLVVAERVMPQLAMLSDPETWQGASYALYLQSSFISSWRGAVSGIAMLILICSIFFSFFYLDRSWKANSGQICSVVDLQINHRHIMVIRCRDTNAGWTSNFKHIEEHGQRYFYKPVFTGDSQKYFGKLRSGHGFRTGP